MIDFSECFIRLNGRHFWLFNLGLILCSSNLGHKLRARDLGFWSFTRHVGLIHLSFMHALLETRYFCCLGWWFELSHLCCLNNLHWSNRVLPLSSPYCPFSLLFHVLIPFLHIAKVPLVRRLLIMLVITAYELIDEFINCWVCWPLFLIFLFTVIIMGYFRHLWS